jgi:hypothetical protein
MVITFLKRYPFIINFYLTLFREKKISGAEFTLIVNNFPDLIKEDTPGIFEEKTFHSIVEESKKPSFAENFIEEILREWNENETPLALKIKEAAFVFMAKGYKEKNIAKNRVNPTLIGYYCVFLKALWLSKS